jgi:hypothetical protein
MAFAIRSRVRSWRSTWLRVEVADRDGDGRIDAHDIVLGDRVEADVGNVAGIDPSEPIRSVSRLRVFRG